MATITTNWRIIWIILTFSCLKINTQAGKHQSYIYSYCTNVTTETDNKALQNLCGQVFITPYGVGKMKEPWTILTTGQKILHVKATLGGDHKVHRLEAEAVALLSHENTVKLVYVPESNKMEASEINHVKGILSLLVIHPSFQSGLEIDSSGQCQVTYATVDDSSGETAQIVTVDKEKTKCQGFQRPLDTWSHSSIPIRTDPPTTQKLVRYTFAKLNGTLMQAIAFEQQEIVLFDGLNLNAIKLTSWQNLVFQKSTTTESLWSGSLDKVTETAVAKIAQQITGTANRVMHLSTIYPLEHVDRACSLNSHLYRPLVEETSQEYYENEDLLFSVLRNLIEKARDSLHAEQFGQVDSMNVILQLIRLLRCLPDRPSTVDLLNEASKMAPTAVDTSVIYRQHGTWREQLVDVLVSCGTPTCVAVLVQRLETLTELAQLKHTKQTGLSSDVIQIRKMLFLKLWPALSHLKRTDNELLERLFECCDQVVMQPMRTLCLMTMANLRHTVKDISIELENQLVENIKSYLLVNRNSSAGASKSSGNQKQTSGELNSRLMIGLSLAKRLTSPQLLQPVLAVVHDSENVPPTIRASAIQTLPNLVLPSDPDTKANYSQINHVRQLLSNLLIRNSDETENDLVTGRAMFDVILSLHPSATELVKLTDQLAHQHRWPLVRACRFLVNQACATGRLSSSDCVCFSDYCPGFPQFGFAGGWSGLAAGTNPKTGEATLIQGDLFNVNDSLIADYSLQVVNGADGEFRQSDLSVQLLSEHGEKRLFEFAVHAEGMDVFANSFGTRSKSKTSKTSETAWANVELNYLEIQLPPWTVFTGGLQDMIQLLWSTPNEPTSVLQVTQNAVDQRLFTVFGTGWVIRIDTLGLFAVQVSAAMETSLWSQSGHSLVRVHLGVVCEARVHVVQEAFEWRTSNAMAKVQGFGGQSTLDFITHVQVTSLPDGICMSMNRRPGTTLYRWNGLHPISDLWLQGRSHSDYRELENPADYQVERLFLPGVSYNLGYNNTRRCNLLGSKTLW